ncbi:MAG: hypothetical protein IJX76_06900 [Clostridia bacterium]|nr:hypothetical protein [Clostridia bacterium]
MKLLIFALVLAISLTGLAIGWSGYIRSGCDDLLQSLEYPSDTETIRTGWEAFARRASFVTPYDLIRSGDQSAEQYAALIASAADPADVEAAREVYRSALWQIRRIHALSWELIF